MKPIQLIAITFLLFGGIAISVSVHNSLLKEAESAVLNSATQEANRITDIAQAWVSSYVASLRGVSSMYLRANQITEKELFELYEFYSELEEGLPLMSAAFAPLQQTERGAPPNFNVLHTTETLGILTADTNLMAIKETRLPILRAMNFPGEVVFGPPFDDQFGSRISLAALYIDTEFAQGVVLSTPDISSFAQSLRDVQTPPGLAFDLSGSWTLDNGESIDSTIY